MNASTWVGALVLCGSAVAAAVDLHHVQSGTLVVYTTSALQDYLEGFAAPAFTRATGLTLLPVYLSAGEEYNRIRLAPSNPEADLFLLASPLLLEQGYQDGIVSATPALPTEVANESRVVAGGHYWAAFGWSPIVEAWSPKLSAEPDLARGNETLGLAHPLLSNNGVYVALLFESLHDENAVRRALERTVVQPTNGRATIAGVADGSFQATLGYEAVVTYYQQRGAKVASGVPLMAGRHVTTPVLFSAALVAHHPQGAAEGFLRLLFSPAWQAALPKYGLRAMASAPAGAPTLL
ncbi:MAG: substrate-binding domain-containing protein [Thermoplasmatota archaeon]